MSSKDIEFYTPNQDSTEWEKWLVKTKWSLIEGKPTTFTPTFHEHISLKSNTDNRSVATIPNDYNGKFEVKGLKSNSVIDISNEGTYSCVLGMRGWGDSSGGNAHEFALTGNGNIYHRHGATTSWNAWNRIAFASDIPTALKNPNSLTVTLNGGTSYTYDGSTARTVNITPASIGASATGHTHSNYVTTTTHDNAINGINLALSNKLDADGTAVNASNLGGNSPSYYRNASNLNAGTVPIARLPVGTGSSQVAAGNHTHSNYVTTTTHNNDIDNIITSLDNKLGKLDTAANAFQLGGQSPSHYLNYNNLSNKPTTLIPLRTRAETTSLTSVASGNTVGSVPLSSTVGRGDTLLIELNTSSSYTYSPKYIMVTLGTDSTSPNSTSGYRNFSFSTFNGTDFNIYSFTVSASGSTLYFGSKKNLNGVFSGTTIAWTTASYTLYVGKVWKVS